MHGIGNDFVLIDALNPEFSLAEQELPNLAKAMCDRAFGIGADGLIVSDRPSSVFRMRMWNPDGTESEMCGNGVRCFAWFLIDQGLAEEGVIPVDTLAGRLNLKTLPDRQVSVDMGMARLTRAEIGMTGKPSVRADQLSIEVAGEKLEAVAVSMGNPHLVVFTKNLAELDLLIAGPRLENHPEFVNRTNVHFVEVTSRSTVIQRTWERGAGATLACGTGACAVVVASILKGYCENLVEVTLPGGKLQIKVGEDFNIQMTGPTQKSFEGKWAGRRGVWPEDNVFKSGAE